MTTGDQYKDKQRDEAYRILDTIGMMCQVDREVVRSVKSMFHTWQNGVVFDCESTSMTWLTNLELHPKFHFLCLSNVRFGTLEAYLLGKL